MREDENQYCEERQSVTTTRWQHPSRIDQLQQFVSSSSSSSSSSSTSISRWLRQPGAIAIRNPRHVHTMEVETDVENDGGDDDDEVATSPLTLRIQDLDLDALQQIQEQPIHAYSISIAPDEEERIQNEEEYIRGLQLQLDQIGDAIETIASGSRVLTMAVPMFGDNLNSNLNSSDEAGNTSDIVVGSARRGSSKRGSRRSTVFKAIVLDVVVAAAMVVSAVAVVTIIDRRGGQGKDGHDDVVVIPEGYDSIDCPSYFQTTQELYDAVDLYLLLNLYNLASRSNLSNSSLALRYGWPIGAWCVGKISVFSFLFSTQRSSLFSTFNDDISMWDVSNATTLHKMFGGASLFDGYLGDWNVSKVVNMESAFEGATSFTGNGGGDSNNEKVGLSKWDVSNVESLWSTFRNTPNFYGGNISSWNVSKVQIFRNVFSSQTVAYFNDDLSNWDVSNGIDFDSAFKNQINFNADLSSWNVSKAVDMDHMFEGASSFVGTNISNWNVSNVESFDSMFMGCKSFDDDLSTWDVSSAIEMKWMFYKASSFRQNLCDWGEKLVSSSLPSSRSLSWKALEGKRRRQSEDAETNDNSFVRGMFFQTFCPMGYAPNLTDPPGPFCFECTL